MIAAFLQLYNESKNGNLIRCLDNCRKWSDEVFIYDDCSTDDSMDVYKQYNAKVIRGESRNFGNEIFNKQKLLDLVLDSNPEWIVWQDGDAIMSGNFTSNMRSILGDLGKSGHDGAKIHYMNLWRHPAYYRLDSAFNGLSIVAFWKNNGRLKYDVGPGLHKPQCPNGMQNIYEFGRDEHIIHYGFASEINIARKYLTYKSFGQTGIDLDRLIDERCLSLRKVPKSLYPPENIPNDYDVAQAPIAISYDDYRQYNSWEDFLVNKRSNTESVGPLTVDHLSPALKLPTEARRRPPALRLPNRQPPNTIRIIRPEK